MGRGKDCRCYSQFSDELAGLLLGIIIDRGERDGEDDDEDEIDVKEKVH